MSNKCILTEHDQIVEAFHNKYKCEEGKRWLLKEEDLPEVFAAVNNYGLDDWMKVAWAVQATMVRSNLKKGYKKYLIKIQSLWTLRGHALLIIGLKTKNKN